MKTICGNCGKVQATNIPKWARTPEECSCTDYQRPDDSVERIALQMANQAVLDLLTSPRRWQF